MSIFKRASIDEQRSKQAAADAQKRLQEFQKRSQEFAQQARETAQKFQKDNQAWRDRVQRQNEQNRKIAHDLARRNRGW